MGKDRHVLPENKIGIYYDEPQWCCWITEETRRSLKVQVRHVLLFFHHKLL